MIEPRLSLLHVHKRRESLKADDETLQADREYDSLLFVEQQPFFHPALEYEVVVTDDDDDGSERSDRENNNGNATLTTNELPLLPPHTKTRHSKRHRRRLKLGLSFVCLLFSGTGTVVFMKLQAIPMYNYPNFLNLACHFFSIPLCFLFSNIMIGSSVNTTPQQQQIITSQTHFMIMGALDCLAATLQIFASIHVPGNLLVLLPQAVIPCSMALSHLLLNERYHWRQYVGAGVVLLGLVVVLEPVFTYERSPDFYCQAIHENNDCAACQTEHSEMACMMHVQAIEKNETNTTAFQQNACQWLPYHQASQKEEGLTLLWSLLLLASAIPMTLSTMYKQVALNVVTDPVYLNGWISVYQFLFALVVAVPAAWMTRVTTVDVPRNMWDGLLCFVGQGQFPTMLTIEDGILLSLTLFLNVSHRHNRYGLPS